MSTAPIKSERLLLIPAGAELLAADLESPEALAAAAEVTLPPDWPPPFHTDKLIRFMQEKLEDPADDGWWLHYFALRRETDLLLLGAGGFKGAPGDDGVIEIGYALVPSARGKGYATEAAKAMVAAGWDRGASVVRAETLPDLQASIDVMKRAGMTPARSERAGQVAYEVRRG